jgi:Zinc knuckle
MQQNNACFQCSEIGHYAQNCPKKQARANLINFQPDDDQYDFLMMEPDKTTLIRAEIYNMSFGEK